MFSSSEGFLKRSSIPSVPVNYNKQQKTGKSFIPRFMTKQATIDHHGLKKDSARTRDTRTKASISYSSTIYSEPLEIESSPKSTKKVEEKPRQKGISLSRKSKIPVSSTEKTCTLTPSTKKDNTKTRTSHRNCTSCASTLNRSNSSLNRVNSIKNTVNNVKNTVKRKSSRVLRCKDDQDNGNVIKDDDASSCSSTSTSKKPVRKLSQNFFNKKRVSPLQPSTTLTKSDDLPPPPTYDSHNDLVLVSSPTLAKSDDLSPTFDSPKEPNDLVLVCSPTLTKSDDLSPSHKESNDLVCSPTSTKCDDLLPTFDLHKETNDLVLVCTPTLIKSDGSLPIPNLHKEINDLVLVCSSLKIKQISFQGSVNKPEASISITHSNLEVSTTTSIINPELVPISLYYKKETDLSDIKHQYVEESDSEVAPTLVNNVCKNIVRFSKFISKIKSLV